MHSLPFFLFFFLFFACRRLYFVFVFFLILNFNLKLGKNEKKIYFVFVFFLILNFNLKLGKNEKKQIRRCGAMQNKKREGMELGMESPIS